LASEERLLDEVRRLREEISGKIQELEERVKKLEDAISPSRIVSISWRIARVEASAHRILSMARNTLVSVPDMERDLRDYFADLGSLVEVIRGETGAVSWDLVKSCTSVAIHAAKTAGLPFRIIANIAIDKLGEVAADAIDEKVIKEVYGLVDLDYWRRLVAGYKRP
jgi:chromosome segregation ATPase